MQSSFEALRRNTQRSVGEVFLLDMGRDIGITPKDGYDTRRKMFVILGFDDEGNAYGGVVFNSTINKNLHDAIARLHIPISSIEYSFLKYDCFLDCSKLFEIKHSVLIQGECIGNVSSELINKAILTIKSNPTISIAKLFQFGII